jgi:hypothetical protein
MQPISAFPQTHTLSPQAEQSWLKKVWNICLKVKKTYKTKSKELGALSISDMHSTTMALKYVSYIQKHLENTHC